MKRLLALAVFWFAWVTPLLAQVVNDAGPSANAGAYNTSTPTCTAGKFCLFQTDVNGNLKVVGTTTPIATQTVGTTNFGTSQIAVPTTPGILVVATRTGVVGTGRKTVCVTNITGTSPVYISGSTPVTSSNGMFIAGSAGASMCLDTQSIVYGISGGGTQTVSYSETY